MDLALALAQRVEPKVAPGLTYRPLLRTRLAVVGRRGHPRAHAHSLAELHDADWLVGIYRRSEAPSSAVINGLWNVPVRCAREVGGGDGSGGRRGE